MRYGGWCCADVTYDGRAAFIARLYVTVMTCACQVADMLVAVAWMAGSLAAGLELAAAADISASARDNISSYVAAATPAVLCYAVL